MINILEDASTWHTC